MLSVYVCFVVSKSNCVRILCVCDSNKYMYINMQNKRIQESNTIINWFRDANEKRVKKRQQAKWSYLLQNMLCLYVRVETGN